MFKKIKKWLYSYPDHDDWFGVHIRESVQQIFPCKHEWEYSDGKFSRKCKKCWKQQKMYWQRYGSNTIKWRDHNIRK